MQTKIVELIKQLATKHEVSQAKIAELLAETMVRTYNKQKPDQKIDIIIDVEKGTILTELEFVVIEDKKDGEYDDFTEIPISEANKHGTYKIGDTCKVPYDIFSYFKKTEIITIMQIFQQKLNEINNAKVYEKWAPRVGELVFCMVEKHDAAKNFYIIDLDDGNMGFMSRSDSIPNEILKPGQKYKFYVKEVKEHSKGWPIILSRADAQFALRLLELECPEVANGEIIVNKIERIAGFKTKIAVSGNNVNYEPTAIIVGPKGSRIKTLSEQLNNEKIDIIKYSDNPKEFLVNACGAKNLVGFKYMPSTEENEQPYATLVVNEDVLPIIIGKKGFNIKLISKLLNCGIDINTVQEAKDHKLDYEAVVVTNTHFFSNNRHDGPRQFSNNNSYNGRNNTRGPNMQNNAHQSNDSILSDIANLSQEELEARYNVKLKSNIDDHHPQTNSHKRETMDDLLDEQMQQEYEDMELSDAFADEIADLLNETKK